MTTQIRPSTLENTPISAGDYGGSSVVPTFTVDAQGRLTRAANVAIGISSSSITGTFSATSITGLAASATTDTTDATNITSGTLAAGRLPVSGIIAGVYGSGTNILSITVDTYGRITSISNNAISFSASSITGLARSATVDATNATNITSGTLDALRLPASGVTARTYGTSTTIPTITVDTYGRITSVSNTAISTTINLSNALTGTGSVSGGGTLVISGGTGVTSTVSANNFTISLPQAVATTSSVRFGSLGVGTPPSGKTGEILAFDNITAYYSDARLKNFLGTIPNALQKVLSLNGYYFVENEKAKELGYNNDKKQVGVSAQEVEAVLPEVIAPAPVNANFEGADYKTVHYEKLIPLLIEAIKEQQKQIDELKNK